MPGAVLKPGLYDLLEQDLRRLEIGKGGVFAMLRCALIRPGFLAVVLYRFSSACIYKGRLGKLAGKLLWRANAFISACDISPQAVIGGGLHLPHPMGVVVGEATLGRNVRLLQNVAIGLRRFSDVAHDPSSYPVIGDEVTIGAGAVLMGAIKIGNGALVGANAVVTADVPDGCVAVGVPARVL